jgi:hypothetical protein
MERFLGPAHAVFSMVPRSDRCVGMFLRCRGSRAWILRERRRFAGRSLVTIASTKYDIAVDASGKMYVVDSQASSSGAGSIDVFAANPSGFLDVAPLATIAGPNTGLVGPGFLALDRSGRIYVTDPSLASIFVFPANPVGTLDGVWREASGPRVPRGARGLLAVPPRRRRDRGSRRARSTGYLRRRVRGVRRSRGRNREETASRSRCRRT